MNINGTYNHLQLSNQFAIEQIGRIKDHTVKFINQALMHIQQDSRLIGVTVAVTNILLTVVIFRSVGLINLGFTSVFGPQKNWTKDVKNTFNFAMMNLIFSLIGINITLYKVLKLPLSPIQAFALSTITSAAIMTWAVSD